MPVLPAKSLPGAPPSMPSQESVRRPHSTASLDGDEVRRLPSPSLTKPRRPTSPAAGRNGPPGPAAHLAPWRFELVASLISSVTLAGLMITLAHFDGREYRQWRWQVTLNGIVALISTVCHTAIMVPLGSAISQAAWLYYLPPDSPGRRVPHRDLDHLETFHEASRGAVGSVRLLWQVRGRNLVALGAVLTVLALAFDTCTQQVVSLQSRSVTAGSAAGSGAGEVPRSSYEGGYDHGSIMSECAASSFRTACNATSCQHTMPTGIFSVPRPLRMQNPLFQVTAHQSGGARYNASSTDTAYVGVFDAIGVPWGEIVPDPSRISATECSLWICAQAYHISSRNGVQTQITRGTWSRLRPPSAGSGAGTGPGNRTLAALPAGMNPAPDETFAIRDLALRAMQNGLRPALAGTIDGGAGTKSYSTDFIQAVWKHTRSGDLALDLDPWVQRLARSMTNTLRRRAAAPAAPAGFYAGTAWHARSFFAIRWAWLTLPSLIVLAALLFLGASIVRSARAGVPVVKGSPLALLCSDLDP
ncbi:hypothetical protein BUE80_DR012837, partial [Diplocarpon rosae]